MPSGGTRLSAPPGAEPATSAAPPVLLYNAAAATPIAPVPGTAAPVRAEPLLLDPFLGRSWCPRSPVRPGIASFLVVLAIALAFSVVAWQLNSGPVGVMGWVTTFLWTLPFTSSVLGLAGAVRTVRRLRASRHQPLPPAVTADTLLVVLPSIGRWDTYPALERVVGSYCRHLPSSFPHLRVDVVIEEDCEARAAILRLAGPMVRVVVVPRAYRTLAGTRFKARANHYAAVRRAAEGEARADVWVLHMDDDTGVGPDTAQEMARFVYAQRERGPDALHLAQGVLSYPREHGANRLIWMADAVRPAQDVSLFAITTGAGMPWAGMHGELLLVRASIEAEIGWDFGPRAVTEDTQFALSFVERHPGRSDWFPGRSFGAAPASLIDLLRQRERWAWGLLELAANRGIPLRHRLLLIHNMVVWSCGPLQHIAVIALAGVLLGDLDTFPATALLLPLWAVNVAYQVWTYWEGLRINVAASDGRGPWWERPAVVALIPVFSLWEAIGFLRGFVRFVRHGETSFTVIAKPL